MKAWGNAVASAKVEADMYVLETANGPLDGKRWEFDSSIVIGRDAGSAQAALPVDHAVSRRHAQITVEGEKLTIVDLGSSNGTILRGEPISSAAPLDFGEDFVVGRTMLRIMRATCQTPS
jgi:pSer/pThr/pTyr-binding forkhead associated (FHA) protein